MAVVLVYFMAQHGIGTPGWEAYSATIFGLPGILLHVLAELPLTFVPAEVLIALPITRGEPVTGALTDTTLASLVAATFGALPRARGESSEVAAKVVNVNAVMTAPRRRIFFIFYFWFDRASLLRRL